jgi:hypothetical protein
MLMCVVRESFPNNQYLALCVSADEAKGHGGRVVGVEMLLCIAWVKSGYLRGLSCTGLLSP